MKTPLTLTGLALLITGAWYAHDLALADPGIFFAGLFSGILLTVMAGFPVGLLVLAATRRRDQEPGYRERGHHAPTARPVDPAHVTVLPPAGPYPAMPPPPNQGMWYSPGANNYDLDWHDQPGGKP